MPIMVSYNFQGAAGVHNNRMQSMFERFGWQQIGGSCYRYPPLANDPPVEDWVNCVIPALMLFRTYVAGHGLQMSKLTIDAHSSTGVDIQQGVGAQPETGANIQLQPPTNQQFGLQNLRDWIDGVPIPYAPQPGGGEAEPGAAADGGATGLAMV
jgi:hypothetical protein